MDLIKKYPELAKSILDGALSAVREKLIETGTLTIWYDADGDKEWEGDHVRQLCEIINNKISQAAKKAIKLKLKGKNER